MKTPIAATLMMLASVAATTASAYSFNPPNASVRLHGKLTFTPNNGQGQPFTCAVTMDVKTKINEIKAVNYPHGDCEGVDIQLLPLYISIHGPDSGQFSFTGFTSFSGNCGAGAIAFEDNGSGIWTIPTGQCLSGTLKSTPPLTIVP